MLTHLRELLKVLSTHETTAHRQDPARALQVVLHELSRAMSSAIEGGPSTFQLFCEAVTSVVGVERALLLQLDHQHRRLTVIAANGMIDLNHVLHQEIPRDAGVFGRCLNEQRPLQVDPNVDRLPLFRDVYRTLELQHFIAAPLIFGDRLLGVLVADSRLDHSPFTDNDLQLMSILANLAAVARQTAESIADLKARNDRLNALLDIANAMSDKLDLDPLLDVIMDRAISLTRADTGAILRVDEYSQQLQIHTHRGLDNTSLVQHPLKPGEGITGWVLLEQRSIRLPDVTRDPRYIMAHAQVRSELAVPIRQADKVVGVINVDSFRVDAFTELDQQVLEVLAAHAAVALRNASLFTELRQQIGG